MRLTINAVIAACAGLIMLAAGSTMSRAASDPVLDKEIVRLAEDWAKAKYLSKDDSERQARMDALGGQADALAQKYPGRVEALIWDGIITSERASLTWGLSALNHATRARDILLQAYKIDPKALDAGAPTSLGVLYYRVPGFPMGFGDNSKARQYLEQAVSLAPNGRDAHYFYADFLYEQGEYEQAEKVLTTALSLPHHPERPVWDLYFPKVMEVLLTKVRAKMKS
jgi:tetratricopeptide (TPR) repeat protein